MAIQLDIKEILDRIPHRYPMLLVDRVLEMVPGKSIKALKNVSINEPFFTGHFPHHPVMPGVLILEAMAQAAAIFSFADETGLKPVDGEAVYYFVGIDGARFRKPVLPGDQLIIKVKLLSTVLSWPRRNLCVRSDHWKNNVCPDTSYSFDRLAGQPAPIGECRCLFHYWSACRDRREHSCWIALRD
jgi:3-hydroxyacyl-[acyl-carrier-protein] dehydratase